MLAIIACPTGGFPSVIAAKLAPTSMRLNVTTQLWFGENPRLLKEVRGEGVDKLITAVDHAAKEYPWPNPYVAFPGPNSNTFTAWIVNRVPELGLELPFSAIGSGYGESSSN